MAQFVQALRCKLVGCMFRFPMGSLGYFIDLILGSTQLLTEINTRDISGRGLKAAIA